MSYLILPSYNSDHVETHEANRCTIRSMITYRASPSCNNTAATAALPSIKQKYQPLKTFQIWKNQQLEHSNESSLAPSNAASAKATSPQVSNSRALVARASSSTSFCSDYSNVPSCSGLSNQLSAYPKLQERILGTS